MLQSKRLLIALFAILLVGGAAVIWGAVSQGDEEQVPLSETPSSVLNAANSAVAGGEIQGVEVEVEDGARIYEVSKVVDGVEYEIEVTEDGAVKKVEKGGDDEEKAAEDEAEEGDDADEEEIAIDPSQVPSNVLDAANEAVPGGTIKEVEKETDDGIVIYDVEKVVDGGEYEIEVTADGTVKEIEKEAQDEDDED